MGYPLLSFTRASSFISSLHLHSFLSSLPPTCISSFSLRHSCFPFFLPLPPSRLPLPSPFHLHIFLPSPFHLHIFLPSPFHLHILLPSPFYIRAFLCLLPSTFTSSNSLSLPPSRLPLLSPYHLHVFSCFLLFTFASSTPPSLSSSRLPFPPSTFTSTFALSPLSSRLPLPSHFPFLRLPFLSPFHRHVFVCFLPYTFTSSFPLSLPLSPLLLLPFLRHSFPLLLSFIVASSFAGSLPLHLPLFLLFYHHVFLCCCLSSVTRSSLSSPVIRLLPFLRPHVFLCRFPSSVSPCFAYFLP